MIEYVNNNNEYKNYPWKNNIVYVVINSYDIDEISYIKIFERDILIEILKKSMNETVEKLLNEKGPIILLANDDSVSLIGSCYQRKISEIKN